MQQSTNNNITSVEDSKIKATTVAWLNRQTQNVAEDRLWEILHHNLSATKNMLTHVSTWDVALRQVRLGSDLLPMYTESNWRYFWQKLDVKQICETGFKQIGDFAKQHNIRLSFHPGQFCALASGDPGVVSRSIDDIEYHADMARWMGFGNHWHDHGFKINVHISGIAGPAGIIKALQVVSPEARNLITIENSEFSWGLDSSLELEKHVALVLDIHHHLLYSNGEYILPTDTRWTRIIESWKGVRPVIHYSLSREDLMPTQDPDVLPDINRILDSKILNKAQLRAHSDSAWNRAQNNWALGFWSDADIMVEAKNKNLAAYELFQSTKIR